ncbi:protein translocase subunit SecF [Psychrilyobacter piezotolerans]|uniref:Protein-export membrane protein SecF n=1 Tax=Psychrilyobacter piezotolerans TaxID=2293438 RepID=A0ABX9KGS6_9FUSO|nr:MULTISPECIES: protein translocase subunit SecF [Psychrilyobacter]MCS5421524.1 protein translocase subunit SecF [Psychrilyobacter sp. S5]NDI77751.1 protein translocase subunit SecF [Psychrilyobacter piezotolerans]RDE61449.1 protein translocase subunit SecF [Psychrilyobacter sp. S5]REI40970.1 protein translocase subunit SecF [Psychrilyobacter piezotolerans]
MKIKIIENRKKFFTFSTILVVLALVSLMSKGLNYGLDFSGGNLIQVKFEKTMELKELNPILDEIALDIPQIDNNSRKVQISDGNEVIIRTPEMSEKVKNDFMKDLEEKGGKFDLLRSDKVGASIGEELKSTAIIALFVGLILIVGYITVRFEFKFALAAVIALFHDVIIAVGGIALLGYEVNTPFIAAVLTILGYSINDTIVVFDRIREVLKKKKAGSLGEAVDLSVNQTLTRSINTSFTTFLAILAILLFGGASLKVFITTLLIGVLIGTYSSIFLASPLIYLLDKNEKLEDIGHN